jgi:tetratricopeptide (TPR) repeat protein
MKMLGSSGKPKQILGDPFVLFKPHYLGLILLLLIGCAGQPISRKEPAPVSAFQIFPQKYRQRALEYERSQELPKALFSWKVVHSFLPDDREALERIAALEKWMRKEAEEHFLKGLDSFHKKSIHEAQKEFLIALTYNPDHTAALDYLKHRLRGSDYILYEIKEGDTLKKIAKKIYNDPEKDFLIGYFNDLGNGVRVKPGKTLELPVLDPDVMTKP